MSYKDLVEFAKDNCMKVNVLAWGYANRYNKNGEYAGSEKVPDWVRLDPDWHPKTGWDRFSARVRWILLNIKWAFSGLKRYINNLPKWWALRKRCKEVNKFLLAEAEKTRNRPPYPPPTEEEVRKFIEENPEIACIHQVEKLRTMKTLFEKDI